MGTFPELEVIGMTLAAAEVSDMRKMINFWNYLTVDSWMYDHMSLDWPNMICLRLENQFKKNVVWVSLEI